jgi:hypothetical protein
VPRQHPIEGPANEASEVLFAIVRLRHHAKRDRLLVLGREGSRALDPIAGGSMRLAEQTQRIWSEHTLSAGGQHRSCSIDCQASGWQVDANRGKSVACGWSGSAATWMVESQHVVAVGTCIRHCRRERNEHLFQKATG